MLRKEFLGKNHESCSNHAYSYRQKKPTLKTFLSLHVVLENPTVKREDSFFQNSILVNMTQPVKKRILKVLSVLNRTFQKAQNRETSFSESSLLDKRDKGCITRDVNKAIFSTTRRKEFIIICTYDREPNIFSFDRPSSLKCCMTVAISTFLLILVRISGPV